MLIHDGANRTPTLVDEAPAESDALRDLFGDAESSTQVVNFEEQVSTLRDALRGSRKSKALMIAQAGNINQAMEQLHHTNHHTKDVVTPS